MSPSANVLRLPQLDPPNTPGSQFARSAMNWILGIVALLTVFVVAISLIVKITITVNANGTLEPRSVWSVRTLESGIVSSVRVSQGEFVHSGDTIAVLDAPELIADIARLEASIREHSIALARSRAAVPLESRQRVLRSAQADARAIQANAAMRDRLLSFGIHGSLEAFRSNYVIGTHVEIDKAIAEVLAAEAERKAEREESSASPSTPLDVQREVLLLRDLERQALALRKRKSALTLLAQVGGTVQTGHPEQLLGQVLRPGDVALDMADVSGWKALLTVSEHDVLEVAVGDSVLLELPALRRAAMPRIVGSVVAVGQGTTLARTGDPTRQVGNYEIVVGIDSALWRSRFAMRLKAGLAVRGTR